MRDCSFDSITSLILSISASSEYSVIIRSLLCAVWVKVGAYRWWPAVVLHPTKVSILAHTSTSFIIHTEDSAFVTPDSGWFRSLFGSGQDRFRNLWPSLSLIIRFKPSSIFFPKLFDIWLMLSMQLLLCGVALLPCSTQ
jgi:hypothetical protein